MLSEQMQNEAIDKFDTEEWDGWLASQPEDLQGEIVDFVFSLFVPEEESQP